MSTVLFLDKFNHKFDTYIASITPSNVSALQPDSKGGFKQIDVFKSDLHEGTLQLCSTCKKELFTLTQQIGTLVLSPFALLIDLFRCCLDKTVKLSDIKRDVKVIPKHLVQSILKLALSCPRIADECVTGLSQATGLLLWHSGESIVRTVRQITAKEVQNTVLSDNRSYRHIVYNALGITALSAAALCLPIIPIQLVALPIIMGSLYGTINNQFTVRECPEYYTMGHVYDGTDLKKHAVKTNNVLIKPVVTGCYATTMVTKFAGAALAAVGTLPFAPVVLPVRIAAKMIGVVLGAGLTTGHLFAQSSKNELKQHLEEFGKLYKIEIRDHEEKTWKEFTSMLIASAKKRHEGWDDEKMKAFMEKAKKLFVLIEEKAVQYPDVPLKYLSGWEANNTRNSYGYLFAGVGTVALSITTIFLRLFAL